MIIKQRTKADTTLITSLCLLAGGVISLRLHYDFWAGFGVGSATALLLMGKFTKNRDALDNLGSQL
jgi:hypothetical protein